MVKLHKVKGEKIKYDLASESGRTIFPTFQLTEKDLPEIKDWKVGEKYMLEMEVEQIAMREGSEWSGSENDNERRATFKIVRIGADTDEDEEMESGEPMSYGQEYASQMKKRKS